MGTFTSRSTKNNVFANSQDRVVVSMRRGTCLYAALHLIAWPARLVHRSGCAIKRAAQAAAAGADLYAERIVRVLSGSRLCPQPVRRQSPASANDGS